MTTEHISDLKDGFLVSFHMENRWYTQFFPVGEQEMNTTFPVAVILNFVQDGRQKSTTLLFAMVLKPTCPYLTPCQIWKTWHQVHDSSEFPLR